MPLSLISFLPPTPADLFIQFYGGFLFCFVFRSHSILAFFQYRVKQSHIVFRMGELWSTLINYLSIRFLDDDNEDDWAHLDSALVSKIILKMHRFSEYDCAHPVPAEGARRQNKRRLPVSGTWSTQVRSGFSLGMRSLGTITSMHANLYSWRSQITLS